MSSGPFFQKMSIGDILFKNCVEVFLNFFFENVFPNRIILHHGYLKTFSNLRCPNDSTMKYHSAPSVGAQRFSLEAFKFIADHPFVFVHCHVIVCNASDPGSKCAKSCSSSGRGRREVGGHMTKLYSLAQGPLHLVRQKREEKRASGLDNSGK